MTNDLLPESTPQTRWRFRFGLKALFVVMTILCVWLGFKVARERRAMALVARHRAVLNTIVANVLPAPAETLYRLNPGSRDKLLYELSSPGDQFDGMQFRRFGSTARITSQALTIDVSQLLQKLSPTEVSKALARHYAQGLQQQGMEERHANDSIRPAEARRREVWATGHNELSLIIDVEVAARESTAEVRILLIDAQQLHLW